MEVLVVVDAARYVVVVLVELFPGYHVVSHLVPYQVVVQFKCIKKFN